MIRQHGNRMLWALGAESLLLAAAFLFWDQFPPRVLKTVVILAVALPVICYLPLAMKPAVYGAWLAVFKELRRGLIETVQWLIGCFNKQTAICLFRKLAELEACPRTSDAWLALPLFPFKVYIVAAVPFLRLSWAFVLLFFSYPNRWGYHQAVELVARGYLISCGVLLVGTLLQALCSRRERFLQTLLMLVLGMVMLCTLFPWRLTGR